MEFRFQVEIFIACSPSSHKALSPSRHASKRPNAAARPHLNPVFRGMALARRWQKRSLTAAVRPERKDVPVNGKLAVLGLVALWLGACKSSNSTPRQSPVAPRAASPGATAAAGEQSPTPPAMPPSDGLAFKHDHEGPVSHLDRVRELKSSGDYEGALLEARCAL